MHPFATRSSGASSMDLVRLACVKHAASVHSEPGSNSPLKSVRTAEAFGPDRLMRVKPCCVFLKTLVFPKNQEKDVWHALLSFQGTAPPGMTHHPSAAPYLRRDCHVHLTTDPPVYGSIWLSQALFWRPSTPPRGGRLSPKTSLGKNQPLRGTGI